MQGLFMTTNQIYTERPLTRGDIVWHAETCYLYWFLRYGEDGHVFLQILPGGPIKEHPISSKLYRLDRGALLQEIPRDE